ncbi:hypothetical protein JCM19238_3738 [Vibrio ponticus]|nr:hypothetical protein JCM19238_3738 [Vibrio ponticus]
MKVLIAGSSGYIGRHVMRFFISMGAAVYRLQHNFHHKPRGDNWLQDKDEQHAHSFDVVINCARPHWSKYTAEQIVIVEQKLLSKLDQFAKPNAIKLHTSGIWLFGNATPAQLQRGDLAPIAMVALDKMTIEKALANHWQVVYLPSLVYGGEHCQLERIIAEKKTSGFHVALPSTGLNSYVHVEDIAEFYFQLAMQSESQPFYFIAEPQMYSPFEFAELLQQFGRIKCINKISWLDFEVAFGKDALAIEKLHLAIVPDAKFKPRHCLLHHLSTHSLTAEHSQ